MSDSPLLAVLTITVPALVAVVIGYIGYRQAVKVANRNAKSQSEQLNLQTFTSLNEALSKEIERVRADRKEDQERAASELSTVTRKLSENAAYCEELSRKLLRMEAWTDAVVRILQHPSVAPVIAANGFIIPPPPVD